MEHHKNLTEVNFMITVCSIVTLSINDNINFLENIKKGFKRTVSWNIYRSEITTQTKHSDYDYLIDPTFITIDRLLGLSFKNGNDGTTRDYLIKITCN